MVWIQDCEIDIQGVEKAEEAMVVIKQQAAMKTHMEKLQAEVDELKSDMSSFEKRAKDAELALTEQQEKNSALKKKLTHKIIFKNFQI